MAADSSGYLQVNTAAYPSGATRGQLELVIPTTSLDVGTWMCPQGTKIDPQGDWRQVCGAVVLLSAGIEPNLGMTTAQDGHPPLPGRLGTV
jgi:hypothetical protein